jgi:hypothetical protein
LLQIRHEKQVILENRIYRENQYNDYRQKEYEQALDREAALYNNAKEEYRHQVGMQVEQHLEIIEKKKQAVHERNVAEMKALVLDLLSLVFKVYL